jgi:ectoine hydroxylase-related dioxygenase (phytanoyl-CoA dioxygenase family)
MTAPAASSPWLRAADCRVEELAAFTATRTLAADAPAAAEIVANIPVYDCAALRGGLDRPGRREALMTEWIHVLDAGPGVLALRGAFDDAALLDRVSAHFHEMIADERVQGRGSDHFGKAGANDRVWNALQKLCERAPGLFADYYANDMLALVSEAWLGPFYQVTSQINCVNPGSAAQTAHRDYHLGVLTPDELERFPLHVHRLSATLTLQGAVAHVDMPLESGPTLYLPHSHKYPAGYLAVGEPAFQAWFDAHRVQLPLAKGDAVFFNPALMHAAGANRSAGIRRLGNLLQVSSAFGRPMEAVDRARMARVLYPVVRERLASGAMSQAQARHAVAACADGYSFPTNLDRDPPGARLMSESQQALMLRALAEGWPPARFDAEVTAQAHRRRTEAD